MMSELDIGDSGSTPVLFQFLKSCWSPSCGRGAAEEVADSSASVACATDREIDQLVSELYGLTEAEIALVEEATG